MSDWKIFCTNFNTYQDTARQYPSSCPTNDSLKQKTFQEVSRNLQEIAALKSQIDTRDSSWLAANLPNLSSTLRQNVFDFCCLYDAKQRLHTDYQQTLSDYTTAKGRIESVRDPASQIQDKGTTVPFGRPLRSDSVPFVLAFSFLFMILGLGLLLQIGNIKLAYSSPPSYGPGLFDILAEQFQQTSLPVFAITIVGSFVAAGGIYYGISKTKPEWLGLK
jgi:hypothetical protein